MRFTKYFIVCAFFIIFGIVYAREVPKLKFWLIRKIQSIATDKSNFEVTARGLDFTLFPPGIELKKIAMNPRDKKIAQTISPITVDSLGVSLSALALFSGRFEIGRVLILRPQLKLIIKPSTETKSVPSKPFEIPWSDFISLPFKKIIIKNADVEVHQEEVSKEFTSHSLSLSLEKSSSAAKLEIFSPQTWVKSGKDELSLGLATRIILENQAAELSALKITVGNNFLLGRGVARGEITRLQWTTLNFRTLSHMDLKDVLQKLKPLTESLKLPKASGELNFEVIGSVKKNEPLVAAAEINSQALEVDDYKIGGIKGKVKLANNTISTDLLKIQNSAGDMTVKDLNFSLKPDALFSARVQTDGIALETLLVNIGSSKPSLHLDTVLSAACEGNFTAQYKITCAGEAGGKNFRVFKVATGKTVVALKEFKLLTHFIMEKNVMTFPDGTIQIGESVGSANGLVDFEKGFNFNFRTDALNFKDVQSLAELSYNGALMLDGNTKGNGSTATINGHVGTEDFWFQDYHLGGGSFDLAYEKSNLTFSNMIMGFPNTQYTGNIALELGTPTNVNADVTFQKLDLTELTAALSKITKTELPIEGQGTAHINAHGPLALSELGYTLTGNFPALTTYGEAFQNLNISLHSVDGHAYADTISMKKGDGLITMTGDVTAGGLMNLLVKGQDLHVTDFEHVKSVMSGLDGQMQVDVTLQDKILDPSIKMRGLVTQTTINQEPLDNSSFTLDFLPASMIFKSNLFADKIKLEVRHPRGIKAPSFISFDTEKWDFSQFLSAISGSQFKRDYETNLTAHVNLTSETGELLNSHGEIRVPSIFIRHGMYQMQNSKPIIVKFDDGFVGVESLSIKGDNTDLNISGNKNPKDVLNFNIVGSVELSLFNFLTPFFKEMRGGININAQVAGTTDKPEFLGSALLNKASFKFKEFPHGFDDINADILFSQTRIVINKIKGVFAGGDLSGSGTIVVKGLKDVPVDITADLNHVTLNVPEGLTTKGSGQLKLTGNTFPYLLQATYNLDSGIYTQNFGDQESSVAMKRSAFLPNGILQKESSTLDLDLDTHFTKGVTVRNSLVDTEVTGDLNVRGDPKHVILKGEVNAVSGGKLFFRDTPFTINTGKIKFQNPTENNPNIYALAATRLRDWDITLLYQGTLDKHELKLSSSPSLPEKSIISLLALGITDDGLEKNKSSDQLVMQGYQAGSVVLSQTPLVQEVKKKSGVSVRLAQSVDETQKIVQPKFVAEKQWTPKFVTSVGRTFGDRSSQDISAEYRLNRNFSLLGSYENRDYDQFSVLNSTNTTSATPAVGDKTTNVLGVNLQYQVEFK